MRESMPMPGTPNEESAAEKAAPKKERPNHLKVVTEADEPVELTEADMLPTMAEEAQAHMDAERRSMGTAKALGREQRAIREAQAQLAHEAVDELVAEQEAEERDKTGGFGAEQTMKPAAKKASVWDRMKGWFKG